MEMFGTLKALLQRQWKWLAAAALIILALLAVRACSSSKAHQKELYIIGRSSTWYPLQLMGKERNLQAFTNDLMDSVASHSELRFAWLETGASTLFERLDGGSCDAVISPLQPNVVNRERYLFSNAFFKLGPVLIVRKDSDATSLKDMEGKTIAIRSGYALRLDGDRQNDVDISKVTVNSFENMNRALEALTRDKIDGVIMDALQAYHNVEGFYAGKLKIVTAPLTDEGLRLITLNTPSSEALISIFNETLEELQKDGAYTALLAKWNLVDPEKQFLKKP